MLDECSTKDFTYCRFITDFFSDCDSVETYLMLYCCYVIAKVLDGLGIGPGGPPIPPPVTLAVLPYPVEQQTEATSNRVCFVPLPEEM